MALVAGLLPCHAHMDPMGRPCSVFCSGLKLVGCLCRPQSGEARGRLLQGFRSPYRPRREGAVRFGELLERVAAVDREMRIPLHQPAPPRTSLTMFLRCARARALVPCE